MSTVGQREKKIQERVVKLFRDSLIHAFSRLTTIPLLLLCMGCNGPDAISNEDDSAMDLPHPFLLFKAGEAAKIRQRAKAEPLLAECFALLQERAQAKPDGKKGSWTERLEALAFLAAIERLPGQAERAIEALLEALRSHDSEKFYAQADFHSQAEPLRALALAWDFLFPYMSQEQKAAALPGLKQWCVTAYRFTEKQWWREASYNVGAIPVAGYGLLALALRQHARDEVIETCYRDNSILTSNPAIRAERTCLFVKAGPVPYLVILDDHEQTATPVKYEWLWHAPKLPMQGAGTLESPLLLSAEGGTCALQFIQPVTPALSTQELELENNKRVLVDAGLVRIRVAETGTRVRFAALAALQAAETARPRVSVLPVECRSPSACGMAVDLSKGARDFIAWQSEEERVQSGSPLRAGELQTDGLLALVRVEGRKVTGFVLGEGTYLRWGKTWLVKANSSVSVSVGAGDRQIGGRLRTRQGLPPEAPRHARVARLEP